LAHSAKMAFSPFYSSLKNVVNRVIHSLCECHGLPENMHQIKKNM